MTYSSITVQLVILMLIMVSVVLTNGALKRRRSRRATLNSGTPWSSKIMIKPRVTFRLSY